MVPGLDAHARLGHTLLRMTGGTMIESDERSWSSATFSGAQHRFVLDVANGDERRDLSRLASRQFSLPGHVVADVLLARQTRNANGCRLTIEALTVRDS